MRLDLVRQVYEARLAEARQHLTLHHPDERIRQSEVGRKCDDTGRKEFRACFGHLPTPLHRCCRPGG